MAPPASETIAEVLKRHAPLDTGDALDEERWLYPEQGSELLRRAGFAEVSVSTARFEGRFTDKGQALQWSLAWPCRSARLARLDDSTHRAIAADALEALSGGDLSWAFVFNIYLATNV